MDRSGNQKPPQELSDWALYVRLQDIKDNKLKQDTLAKKRQQQHDYFMNLNNQIMENKKKT